MVTLPQPNAPLYPLIYLIPTSVQIFTSITDMIERTGIIPPGFNPQLPPQYWMDTAVSPTQAQVDYWCVEVNPLNATVNMGNMSMSGALASTPNIPPPGYPTPSRYPVRPIPLRALLPNEMAVLGPMGTVNIARSGLVANKDNSPAEIMNVIVSKAMGLI